MQLAERDDVERVQVLRKHTAGSAPGSSPEWRACFQRSDERVGYFRVVLAQRVRGLMPLASAYVGGESTGSSYSNRPVLGVADKT